MHYGGLKVIRAATNGHNYVISDQKYIDKIKGKIEGNLNKKKNM